MKTVVAFAVALTCAGCVGTGSEEVGAEDLSSESQAAVQAPGYLTLLAEATEIFRRFAPGSVLFTSTGRPESGVATRASQLAKWHFLAQPEGDQKHTLMLGYNHERF